MPTQRRSREAWKRIIDAGIWILEHEGREALTIGAVCARARVAPTAIYARVDGRSGLFWAIYQRRMVEIIASYERWLSQAGKLRAGSGERVGAVVRAVCRTFEDNRAFLHPIITFAATDIALRSVGGVHARRFVARVSELLSVKSRSAAPDVARTVLQECIFRSMYGDQWLTDEPESFASFVVRLTALAKARLSTKL